MRPIQLPEPPSPKLGTPEIFEGGVYGVVRRAVVIGNGYPGSENQSIGLVRALGLADKHVLYRVTRPKGGLNEWLHWLPVSLHKNLDYIIRQICIILKYRGQRRLPLPAENGGCVGLKGVLEADVHQIVTMARQTFEKDGPILVVASGRDTISVSSSIKRLASDNAFVVQILHPRLHLNRFDLVITPKHDYYPLTREAQQQVPQFISSAWRDEFAPLPKPLLVVNIGGPTGNCRYGADLARQLTTNLLSVLDSCGSIRICFSNRTPEKVSNVISKELGGNPKVYIWDGQEPNPHLGHLAWADAFVVTADSVSMISEVCSTGKPVYIMGAERCTWKFSEFHKSLKDRGVVRPFTGSENIAESWSYPPLNETAEAASRVHKALAERGWRLRP
ncbi:mitochondrial fission protein ELM1 isoform X2 [Pyrus x bretschneideri]|uniref:mitochondrial fission protein ELM1 isoform X2 n=1 Tax=Pyrus x bretschneideri TaxID=225117 RepID=UPI00202FCDD9|nr:mitochondrial fission protein ELM1 isoform X2 [Pyrus x bretschneideri]